MLTAPPSPLQVASGMQSPSLSRGALMWSFLCSRKLEFLKSHLYFPIFKSLIPSSRSAESADQILLIRWGN